ncbi:MAG: MFS transporter [Pseudomonadota bacterium]
MKRNVALLAAAQALLLTNGITLIAINGLAGFALAPDKRLATVPVMAYVIGSALSTLPASYFMKHYGRRAGFTLGSALGMAGAAVGAAALFLQSFWLLCLGALFSGIYNAFGQYYRFAAADMASADFRSKAISLVLAGGIIGGVLGPEASKITRELLEPRFAASFLTLILFALASMAIVRRLDIPPLSAEEKRAEGRPLAEIMRQPVFIVAVLAAAVGYGVMNLLMSATPLAMDICRHPYADAAFVLEWHVIGMFAPSFFTGSLIKRFGVLNVLLVGAVLMFACVTIAMSGVSLMHFWWALTLLGVGWNFLYIGGTTLLTEAYRPEERAKTQGFNDFLVFTAMTLSSLTSGMVVTGPGWAALNQLALPFLALTALATALLWLKRRAVPAAL